MTANGRLIQARIDCEVVKAVDRLSVEWNLYRNQAIERLLREAIAAYQDEGRPWPYGPILEIR